MVPLHRHQLVRLNPRGWQALLARDWDDGARDCLTQWSAKQLPLVVTRQSVVAAEAGIAVGLPAPGRWGRRRLAFAIARADVLYFDEFAMAERLVGALPLAARPSWCRLCADLKQTDTAARVYGSHGWQLLSGFDHVRAGSDIDLWLAVSTPDQADAAAACLQTASDDLPRLDGELVFSDGAAVAWREWQAWRAGRVKSLLVKTLFGSRLLRAPWAPAMASEPALSMGAT